MMKKLKGSEMTLWIIYKEELLISKIIAEMIQDRLENYIDVSVGKIGRINPSFLVEEQIEYLIIGDSPIKKIPSVEVQKWVLKYSDILKENNLKLKALSGFLIIRNSVNKTLWEEFVNNNIITQITFPHVLCLTLKDSNLAFEKSINKIVKDYCSQFIQKLLLNSS
jgi:hypothetical protein